MEGSRKRTQPRLKAKIMLIKSMQITPFDGNELIRHSYGNVKRK